MITTVVQCHVPVVCLFVQTSPLQAHQSSRKTAVHLRDRQPLAWASVCAACGPTETLQRNETRERAENVVCKAQSHRRTAASVAASTAPITSSHSMWSAWRFKLWDFMLCAIENCAYSPQIRAFETWEAWESWENLKVARHSSRSELS